jgi:ethanolamine utilization cobalamin adenosyltransferase
MIEKALEVKDEQHK